MTTTATALGDRPPVPGPPGDIFTAVGGLAEVHNMCGGHGIARWMQLFSPFHLPGGWSGPIEYVALDPGVSCGEHLHDSREEIYYILAGDAVMRVNGQRWPVSAGDVITAPIGTRHWIGTPAAADEPMVFLVVEMHPFNGTGHVHGPARIPLAERARGAVGWWEYPGDDLDVATVDLSRLLTGPWAVLTQAEIPPETVIGPHQAAPGTAELVLPVTGEAEITVGDQQHKCGPGLPGLAIGAVSPVTVRNPSGHQPLRLVTLGVRR